MNSCHASIGLAGACLDVKPQHAALHGLRMLACAGGAALLSALLRSAGADVGLGTGGGSMRICIAHIMRLDGAYTAHAQLFVMKLFTLRCRSSGVVAWTFVLGALHGYLLMVMCGWLLLRLTPPACYNCATARQHKALAASTVRCFTFPCLYVCLDISLSVSCFAWIYSCLYRALPG